MHILVPLDGSPLAEQAIAPAVALLRRAPTPSEITLLRVMSYGTASLDISGFASPMTTPALESIIAGGQEYLAGVVAQAALQGLRVETIAIMGSAIPNAICQAAEDLKVDLIVMNSHARTGMAHLALGSVAEAVMRHASMPTLIIHGTPTTLPTKQHDEPLTILVPVDGGPLAEAALEPAIRLAVQVQGAIRVVRVLPAHTESTVTDRMLVNATQVYFERLRSAIEVHQVPMYQNIAWGDVTEQIVAVAQEYQTDLIAIATHGRTGLDRLREGSITLDVLHHLATPLLVVHPQAAAVAHPA